MLFELKNGVELRANWVHASAEQLTRVLVAMDEDNMHSLTCVGGFLAQRDVCNAFHEAPHVPIAGETRLPSTSA